MKWIQVEVHFLSPKKPCLQEVRQELAAVQHKVRLSLQAAMEDLLHFDLRTLFIYANQFGESNETKHLK